MEHTDYCAEAIHSGENPCIYCCVLDGCDCPCHADFWENYEATMRGLAALDAGDYIDLDDLGREANGI